MRWKTKMDDGTGKTFKAANLEPCSAEVSRHPELSPIQNTADQQAVSSTLTTPAQSLSAGVPGNTVDSEVSQSLLAPGVQVRVHSLRAQPELNGQSGTVVAWDGQYNGWKVRMDNGSGKIFKPSNLEHQHRLGSNQGEPNSARSHHSSVISSEVVNSGFCSKDEHNNSVSHGTPSLNKIMSGCRVRVHGIQTLPQLNGQLGRVFEWDIGFGRWKVMLDSGSNKLLKEVNLEVVDSSHTGVPSQDWMNPLDMPRSSTSMPLTSVFPGARVCIVGLQDRPELNGQYGRAIEFVSELARWKVLLDNRAGKMIRTVNLQVCPRFAGMSPAPTSSHEEEASRTAKALEALSSALGATAGTESAQEGLEGHLHSALTIPSLPGSMPPLPGSMPSLPGSMSSLPGSMPSLPGSRLQGVIGSMQGNMGMNDHLPDIGKICELWKSCLADRQEPLLNSSPGEPPVASVAAPQANVQMHEGMPSNLSPGTLVQVIGLQVRQELNGQFGFVVGWDAAEKRWMVRMKDGSQKTFKPANVQTCTPAANLQPGTNRHELPEAWNISRSSCTPTAPISSGSYVRVSGLGESTHLNGHCGTVVDWDHGSQRWKVRMDDVSGKLFQQAHIHVVSMQHQHPDHNVHTAGSRTMSAPANLSARGHGHRDKPHFEHVGSRVGVEGLQMRPELNGQA